MNRHSAVRIKNLGTNIGKGMTDDLAFEALAKFPAGVAPDYCFMNRRALEQLRRSRTKVTSPTGVPTLPDNVAGGANRLHSVVCSAMIRNCLMPTGRTARRG